MVTANRRGIMANAALLLVASMCLALTQFPSAEAFSTPSLGLSKTFSVSHARGRVSSASLGLRMAATREGTGKNRMTESAFTTPLVEKVKTDSSAGYEWKVKGDLIEKKLNLQEKVKFAKPGLTVFDEVDQLAAEAIEKGGAQNMDEDEITWRLKWLGLFHRAKQAPGTFMWRLRVPNGIVTTEQWRVAAGIISSYDKGARDDWTVEACGDITTRQNLQLRGLRLEDLPKHWKAMRDVGLFSVQSGMDNVRNLVGNPLAGIDPLEIVDTRPFCEEFTNKLTNNGMGNPEYTNLPRKFNVCFVGSNEMYEHPDINDIAYMPAKNDKGEMGWNIEVGGLLMATRCEFAIPLDAWVPQDKHWALGDAILTTFRDYGYRYTPRTKCRLMFLIDDMGVDLFRQEVAGRYKASTGEELAKAGTGLVPKEWERRDLIGAHKQNDGNNWIGVHVPAGRTYGDEMTAFADIADKYGKGEIRMMVEENVMIPHVSDENLEAALKEIADKIPRWSTAPLTLQKGTVSCTGNQFCGFSNINTKGNAIEIADRMDKKYEFPEGKSVRIHWTGCTNTCGQVQIGDIGLLGSKAKNSAGEQVEGVDVFVGGGIGQTSAIGKVVKKAVPIDEQLEDVLSEILEGQFGAKVRSGYVPTPKTVRAPKNPPKKAAAPKKAVAKPAGPLTMDEVKKHNTKEDCWIVISGQVYDVTGWLAEHPGGQGVIMPNAGGDATEDFTGQGHSKFAQDKLKDFIIGPLEGGGAPPAAAADKDEGGSFMDSIMGLFKNKPFLEPGVKKSAVLMEKTDVSADTRRFRFALPSKRTKLGLPVGNHMQVFAEVDGETVLRSYTPVSGVDERGYFDMVIKIYGKCDKFPAGGKMSQHLDSLSVGDKIDVRGPMGKFEYLGKGRFTVDGVSRSADKIGLIAGGTGITPAYQVIKAILGDANDSTKVSLLFANQTPEDVLLRSDLDKLAKDFPDRFQLHYTVDRASGDWKGSTGFVDEAMIKAHMPAPGDGTFIAACGPPVMLEKAVFPALDSVGYKADDYMSF